MAPDCLHACAALPPTNDVSPESAVLSSLMRVTEATLRRMDAISDQIFIGKLCVRSSIISSKNWLFLKIICCVCREELIELKRSSCGISTFFAPRPDTRTMSQSDKHTRRGPVPLPLVRTQAGHDADFVSLGSPNSPCWQPFGAVLQHDRMTQVSPDQDPYFVLLRGKKHLNFVVYYSDVMLCRSTWRFTRHSCMSLETITLCNRSRASSLISGSSGTRRIMMRRALSLRYRSAADAGRCQHGFNSRSHCKNLFRHHCVCRIDSVCPRAGRSARLEICHRAHRRLRSDGDRSRAFGNGFNPHAVAG